MKKVNRYIVTAMLLIALLLGNIKIGNNGLTIYANGEDASKIETPLEPMSPAQTESLDIPGLGTEANPDTVMSNPELRILRESSLPNQYAGDAQIIDKLLDKDGKPYVGLNVIVAVGDMAIARGICGANGYVSIPGLAEGSYRIMVSEADAAGGLSDPAWHLSDAYSVSSAEGGNITADEAGTKGTEPTENPAVTSRPQEKVTYYEKTIGATQYTGVREINLGSYKLSDFPININEDNTLVEITGSCTLINNDPNKVLSSLIKVEANNVQVVIHAEAYVLFNSGVMSSIIEATGDNVQIKGECRLTQNYNLRSVISIDNENGTVLINNLSANANIGNNKFDFIHFRQSGTLSVSGNNTFTNTNRTSNHSSTVVSGGNAADISVIGAGTARISVKDVTTIIGAGAYNGFSSVGNIYVKDIVIDSKTTYIEGLEMGIGANNNASVGNIILDGRVSILTDGLLRVGIGAIGTNINNIHPSVGQITIKPDSLVTISAGDYMYVGIGAHAVDFGGGNIKGDIQIDGEVDISTGNGYLSLGIGVSYQSSMAGSISLNNAQINVSSPTYVEMGVGADGVQAKIDGGIIVNDSTVTVNTGQKTNVGIGVMGGGQIKARKSIEIGGGSVISILSAKKDVAAAVGAYGFSNVSTTAGDIEIGDVTILSNGNGVSIGSIGQNATVGTIYINSGNILQRPEQGFIDPKMSKTPVNKFGEKLLYYRPVDDVSEVIEDISGHNAGSYRYQGNWSTNDGYDEFVGIYLPERMMVPSITSDSNQIITIDFARDLTLNEEKAATKDEAISAFILRNSDTKEIVPVNTVIGDKTVTLSLVSPLEKETAYEVIIIKEGVFKDKKIGYIKSGNMTREFIVPMENTSVPVGILAVEKVLMVGETDTVVPPEQWDANISFEISIADHNGFVKNVVLNGSKPSDAITLPLGTYAVTETVIGTDTTGAAAYTLRSITYAEDTQTIAENDDAIIVTVTNNRIDMPEEPQLQHPEQPQPLLPLEEQEQGLQLRQGEESQMEPPAGQQQSFVAPPPEVIRELFGDSLVPTGIPNVYEQFNGNDVPLGFVSPVLLDGGDPLNPNDYKFIAVDEAGTPLGPMTSRENPKTGDMSHGMLRLIVILGLVPAVFFGLKERDLYRKHRRKRSKSNR